MSLIDQESRKSPPFTPGQEAIEAVLRIMTSVSTDTQSDKSPSNGVGKALQEYTTVLGEQPNRHPSGPKGPKNVHGKLQPPNRPGYGSKGREIMLVTNYFPVQLPDCLTVHHYDVSIIPSKLPKLLSRQVRNVEIMHVYTVWLVWGIPREYPVTV